MNVKTQYQYWDIFCAVVDNYGDIGVSWRLTKQLVNEYPLIINLWVDDLFSFSHILPQLDPSLMTQHIDGINIRQWNDPLDIAYIPGNLIIEAFGCELPYTVIDQLNQLQNSLDTPPLWLNLEYLSAETWVDGCHGLTSLQPSGLKKFFYFPGFTSKTGGLICEKTLFNERQQWQSHPQNKLDLFTKLGLTGINRHDKIISVFSYETQALAALCELWQTSEQKIHLLIPKGRSLNCLAHLLPCPIEALTSGQQIVHQQLTLHILPMTDQQGFDRLLWSCDLNIVRGEDSFLRAQWAAKPFIWHIYPQEDNYHLVKLEAFMQIYCDNLAPEIAGSWSMLNLAFNQGKQSDVKKHWHNLDSNHSAILDHAKKWPNDALNNVDLATRLVQFVKIS